MRLLAALPLLFLPALAEAQRAAEPLAAPFDIAAINAARGRPLPERPCPPPLPALRDLEGVSYYTDPAHSQIDDARRAANERAQQPLAEWLALLGAQTEQWAEARPRRPEAAACALAHLDAWAADYALLGQFNAQGGYHRKWALAGAALSFLAIRQAPGLDEAAKARVADWLRRVAIAVRPHYDRPARPGAVSDAANNHAYWAGLAVAAAGIAAGDRALLDWGVGRARYGLAQVSAEGALPLELARGKMALHYHLFALQPLAALARLGAANGAPLGAAEAAALRRLTLFTFRATQDPARIEALAGAAQEDPSLRGRPALAQGQGLEIALGLVQAPEIEAAIAPLRPYRHAWLGGPVSLLWRLP